MGTVKTDRNSCPSLTPPTLTIRVLQEKLGNTHVELGDERGPHAKEGSQEVRGPSSPWLLLLPSLA